jgi:uncharacterized protein (DUF2344 family)
VRTLERLFRRAGLALKMSEGFHPKPRLSFPLPMAVGTTGLDEVREVIVRVIWDERTPRACELVYFVRDPAV